MIAFCCANEQLKDKLGGVVNSVLHYNPWIEKFVVFTNFDEIPKNLTNPKIQVIKKGEELWNGTKNDGSLSKMSLLRCSAPSLFPNEDKVLYFDVDIVCLGSIKELQDINMEHDYFAAVAERHKTLPHRPYCNSGFMIMNLKKMRADNIEKQMYEMLMERKYPCGDQDALNYICQPHVFILPCEYNATQYTGEKERPKIKHGTPDKPWYPDSKFHNEWEKFNKNEQD